MSILSIQSHVAYGYVGNRSAAFPLELLGFDVWLVNTVQFSNHTGYESWRGQVFSGALVDEVVAGIAERGVLPACQAVLSGYLGGADIGASIVRAAQAVKKARPGALYCCDPVMGDSEGGIYVREEIALLMRELAVPAADIVTPNQFEAELLSGVAMRGPKDAGTACERLHAMGPRIVLVTSYKPADRKPGTLSMLLSDASGIRVVTTPELHFPTPMSGTGDLLAALFLGHYLKSGQATLALELAADTVYSVLKRTRADGGRELRLVQAQAAIAHPKRRFKAKPF